MCESPLQAWLDLESFTPTGKHPIVFKLPPGEYSHETRFKSVELPCGKCFSCRKARAYELTVRAVFESRLYDHSSFITLTCADENLHKVFPHGVEHRPWQLFAKRLRKRIGPFRFLMCAEYGSRTCRPHYHAIIFGHKFDDVGACGPDYWSDWNVVPSVTLSCAWNNGFVQVDEVNENRIAYVAGYTLKDYQLGRTRSWYSDRGLNLPYVRWSRKPGLGSSYFERYYQNLIKSRYIQKNGDSFKVYHQEFILNRRLAWFNSRYFNQKLQLMAPQFFDRIKSSQELWLLSQSELERELKQNELLRSSMCAQYRVSQKERDIE